MEKPEGTDAIEAHILALFISLAPEDQIRVWEQLEKLLFPPDETLDDIPL